MRRHLLAAAVLLFFVSVGTAQAQDCGVADPDWQVCATDSDCAASTNVCGFPNSYNAKHLEAVKKHHACMAPTVSCAIPPKDAPKRAPYCKEGICALEEEIATGPCGRFDLGWLTCEQDDDCALVKNSCGGSAAYHKDHAEKAATYNQCLSKQVDCRGALTDSGTAKAACVNNTCTLAE